MLVKFVVGTYNVCFVFPCAVRTGPYVCPGISDHIIIRLPHPSDAQAEYQTYVTRVACKLEAHSRRPKPPQPVVNHAAYEITPVTLCLPQCAIRICIRRRHGAVVALDDVLQYSLSKRRLRVRRAAHTKKKREGCSQSRVHAVHHLTCVRVPHRSACEFRPVLPDVMRQTARPERDTPVPPPDPSEDRHYRETVSCGTFRARQCSVTVAN